MLFSTISLLLLPAVNALVYPHPQETAGAPVYPRSRAHDARSPKPTTPPAAARALAKLEKRALANTCGWWNGYALDCDPNLYCAYDTQDLLANCCPVNSGGTFTSCYFQSVCLNSAEKLQTCGTDDCNDGTVWCESATAPNCLTYHLTGEIAGVAGNYLTFRCGTATQTSRTGQITSPISSTAAASSSDTGLGSVETPTATVTVTPTPATPSPTVAPKKSHTAAIAGGVVGGVVGLALIAGAIVFVVWRMKQKKAEKHSQDVPEMTGTVNPK